MSEPTNERIGASGQSGRGLPHSKTLSRSLERKDFRQVLDCGSPLPLWRDGQTSVARAITRAQFFGLMPPSFLATRVLLVSAAAGIWSRRESRLVKPWSRQAKTFPTNTPPTHYSVFCY